MFPTATAVLLRDTYGHDAVHVVEVGLRAADDAQVAATARAEGRAVVTENVADFAAERDVVLVFVLKKNLPAGGGQAAALAKVLDRWAQDHPDPYLGPPWPSTDDKRPPARLCGPRGSRVPDPRRKAGPALVTTANIASIHLDQGLEPLMPRAMGGSAEPKFGLAH